MEPGFKNAHEYLIIYANKFSCCLKILRLTRTTFLTNLVKGFVKSFVKSLVSAFLRNIRVLFCKSGTLTDTPLKSCKKRFITPYHAKNMRHLKHARSQLFVNEMVRESITWSRMHWEARCKFCKRWQCHLRKKMQIDFWKTAKNLCSQILQLFLKNEKFMVSMVSCVVFSNSLKDFSFLDIFRNVQFSILLNLLQNYEKVEPMVQRVSISLT